MKKVVLLTFLAVCSFAAYSQTSIVKLQPIPLVNSTLSLGFEQKIARSTSLQLNVDYLREKDFGFKDSWLGIGLEYRIYNLVSALATPETQAPHGFFVAPTLGIRFFKSIDEDDPDSEFTEKYNFANLGALAGYQWLPKLGDGKRPLALEGSVGLLGGFMLKGEKFDYEDYQIWPRFNLGLVPVINVSVGFAFGK
nr:hypothetical protein [uncultured Dyadobacter sp.]